jgi:hypothetical protein
MNSRIVHVAGNAVLVALSIMVGSAVCAYAQDQTQAASTTASPAAAAPGTEAAGATAPLPGQPETEVSPGAMLEERRALLNHLRQAREHGIGIANYMMAFKSINEQAAAGASESQLKPRVSQLTDALKEQLKRAVVLKTQRPIAPPAPSAAPMDVGAAGAMGGPAGAMAGAPGAPGGHNADALIEKLKERLGPGGLSGLNIPDGLKERLLNSDKGKEILKKLGGQ